MLLVGLLVAKLFKMLGTTYGITTKPNFLWFAIPPSSGLYQEEEQEPIVFHVAALEETRNSH